MPPWRLRHQYWPRGGWFLLVKVPQKHSRRNGSAGRSRFRVSFGFSTLVLLWTLMWMRERGLGLARSEGVRMRFRWALTSAIFDSRVTDGWKPCSINDGVLGFESFIASQGSFHAEP